MVHVYSSIVNTMVLEYVHVYSSTPNPTIVYHPVYNGRQGLTTEVGEQVLPSVILKNRSL